MYWFSLCIVMTLCILLSTVDKHIHYFVSFNNYLIKNTLQNSIRSKAVFVSNRVFKKDTFINQLLMNVKTSLAGFNRPKQGFSIPQVLPEAVRPNAPGKQLFNINKLYL